MNNRVNGGPDASLLPTVALLDGWGCGTGVLRPSSGSCKAANCGKKRKRPPMPPRCSAHPHFPLAGFWDDEHVTDKGRREASVVSRPCDRQRPPLSGHHSRGPSQTSDSPSSSDPRRGGGCLGWLPAWSCLGVLLVSTDSVTQPTAPSRLGGLLCFKMESNVPAKISDALWRMERLFKAVNLLGS